MSYRVKTIEVGTATAGVTTKIRLTQRTNFTLLALNGIGVVLYLWWASHAWAIPQERAMGVHSITGEPFVWALGVFPIWAAFLLLNAIWGLLILRWRRWASGRMWLWVVPIWLIACAIDFAHH